MLTRLTPLFMETIYGLLDKTIPREGRDEKRLEIIKKLMAECFHLGFEIGYNVKEEMLLRGNN